MLNLSLLFTTHISASCYMASSSGQINYEGNKGGSQVTQYEKQEDGVDGWLKHTQNLCKTKSQKQTETYLC